MKFQDNSLIIFNDTEKQIYSQMFPLANEVKVVVKGLKYCNWKKKNT